MKLNYLYYLYYFCDGLSSVFDSQVISQLNALSDKRFFKKIYLYLGFRNANERNDFLDRKASTEIETVFFKSYPNYPFFNFLNRKSIKNALHIQNINLSEVIFHTRGEILAWHLSKILDAKYHKQIIPDVRGASVEEIKEYYNLNKIL